MRRTPLIVAAALAVVAAAVAVVVLRGSESPAEKADKALEAGLAAHVAGNVTTAKAKYREVLAYDASNKFAHYNLGLIEQQAGRVQAAEAAYRRALETDRSYVPALFNLAILITARAPQEALAVYRQVIEIQPNYASAHLNVGFLLKKLGQVEEGDAEIAKAIELDPSLGQTNPPRGSTTTTSVER